MEATATPTETTKPLDALRVEESQSLVDYIRELGGDSPIQVAIHREAPTSFNGANTKGHLDTLDEPITVEEIGRLYGGGKYKIRVSAPNPNKNGRFGYVGSKTIQVAGAPRVPDSGTSKAALAQEPPSIVLKSIEMTADAARRAEDRAEAAEREARARGRAPDSAMERVMDELAAVRRESTASQQQMMSLLLDNKSTPGTSEILLGKMLEGESARIMALQQQHQSEIRQKTEYGQQSLDRVHAQYQEVVKRQEDGHKREVDNLVRTYEGRIESLQLAHTTMAKIASDNAENLRDQMATLRQEIVELRAKKDVGPVESITKLVQFKEALGSLSGADERSSGGTIERIANVVFGSSLAEGVAARIASPLTAPAPASAPVAPVQARTMRLPDGRVVLQEPDGTRYLLRPKQAPHEPTGAAVDIPPDDLLRAIAFMESALQSDTAPALFVSTAKSLYPELAAGPLVELIRAEGVDAFAARVEELNPDSSLLEIDGRSWLRKVAAELLG